MYIQTLLVDIIKNHDIMIQLKDNLHKLQLWNIK